MGWNWPRLNVIRLAAETWWDEIITNFTSRSEISKISTSHFHRLQMQNITSFQHPRPLLRYLTAAWTAISSTGRWPCQFYGIETRFVMGLISQQMIDTDNSLQNFDRHFQTYTTWWNKHRYNLSPQQFSNCNGHNSHIGWMMENSKPQSQFLCFGFASTDFIPSLVNKLSASAAGLVCCELWLSLSLGWIKRMHSFIDPAIWIFRASPTS